MKTLFIISLVLTVIGALIGVVSGMIGKDIINQLLHIEQRTTGSDFLRILIVLSAILTLVYGLKLSKNIKN